MADLTIQLSVDADLPIEVRRADMSLVTRAPASEPIELESGRYFVSCLAPDGKTVTREANVAGSTMLALDVPSFGASPSRRWKSRSRPEARAGELEMTTLGVGLGELEVGLPPALENWPAQVVHGRLQMSLVGGAKTETVVAGDRDEFYRLETTPQGTFALTPANLEASALLKYLRHGELLQATTMLMSERLSAERLLQQKRVDPLAAAVGAYALLRVGDLDRLHEWPRNLRDRFSWLADGAIVEAERQALRGDHGAAIESLRLLGERDLPALSIGLGLAVDRLRLYRSAAESASTSLLPLLKHLTKVALRTDFSQPLTTLRFSSEKLPSERNDDG